MRRGRFAGLNEDSTEVAALGLRDLLLFDLAAPATEEQAKIGADRGRALAVSIPFVAGSHLVWTAVLLAILFLM